jgi:S-adenosylmethionine:tRNA ribosyltransferase-isomerase
VLTAELDYELPEELIAQYPAPERGESQLMVLEAGVGVRDVGKFENLILNQLRDDDLVVANDTRVLRARVKVNRPTGGGGEVLLLEPVTSGNGRSLWHAFARPGKRMQPSMSLTTKSGDEMIAVSSTSDGTWLIDLPVEESEAPAWLEMNGEVPLPPYIAANGQPPERYQTVYAEHDGSVAAPTAGLHFSPEMWQRIADKCEVAHVTLHVGAGTFQPVRVDDLADHTMHAERYSVSDETDAAIRSAMENGRRVVAVGTTTTRVLESVYGPSQMPRTGSSELFITPGYEFGCVGALLTNFHLPKSTLLALVMAFAGEEVTRAAYREAISRSMRFFSFGDAMFIQKSGAV